MRSAAGRRGGSTVTVAGLRARQRSIRLAQAAVMERERLRRLVLRPGDESELAAMASCSRRAWALLALGEGIAGAAIARALHVTRQAVSLWRRGYEEHGLQSLRRHPGRPRHRPAA